GATEDYGDWKPLADQPDVRRVTLFPGLVYERIPLLKRIWRLLGQACKADTICMGIGYNHLDVLIVSWLLRLLGKRVIMLNDTKFEDRPRTVAGELLKRVALACFNAGIVAGGRNLEYFRFLGFRGRRLLPGCDGIDLERVRLEVGGAGSAAAVKFEDRPFVFVGRLVDVKNLPVLIEGYAHYVRAQNHRPRRLVLVGAGPLEPDMRRHVAALGVEHLVDFAGFTSADETGRMISQAAALVLTSYSETWGMVVNEAMALGIPVIVSEAVGSRDVMVRNLVSGIVFESGCSQSLACALSAVGHDEALWHRLADGAGQRAWLGDSEIFADAVELLHFPSAQPAEERISRYLAEIQGYLGRAPY
ncbi:MAG: glycosyltransferase family 4 protein, partial [Sphingomonadales bacterium]|nr:glycosyltransferase family 4 protein [Sphingomonadales bacterium]